MACQGCYYIYMTTNQAAVAVLQARQPSFASTRRRIARMVAKDLARGDKESAARLTAYLGRLEAEQATR